MIRGEIWTVSGAGDYAGKPRPALIVQSDRFSRTTSVTVCPLTTMSVEAPLIRLRLHPTAANGLSFPALIMIDKIVTVPRHKMGRRVGSVSGQVLSEVERALSTFLGIAEAPI